MMLAYFALAAFANALPGQVGRAPDAAAVRTQRRIDAAIARGAPGAHVALGPGTLDFGASNLLVHAPPRGFALDGEGPNATRLVFAPGFGVIIRDADAGARAPLCAQPSPRVAKGARGGGGLVVGRGG